MPVIGHARSVFETVVGHAAVTLWDADPPRGSRPDWPRRRDAGTAAADRSAVPPGCPTYSKKAYRTTNSGASWHFDVEATAKCLDQRPFMPTRSVARMGSALRRESPAS